MRVLVIPDCHLKPWLFTHAAAIMDRGEAERAVCPMDLPDDFGKGDDKELYEETYNAVIAFSKKFPSTLWCYGNHDLSYIWGKHETGYSPMMRELVCRKLDELKHTLPTNKSLAYIHKIDKVLFTHGGLSSLFVRLGVSYEHQKRVDSAIKEINSMGSDMIWSDYSPIWYRPQFSSDNTTKQLYRGGKYLQVVGHTPVRDVIVEGGVLSCDTFSTYRDGTPYGSQRFCIVDTETMRFEKCVEHI